VTAPRRLVAAALALTFLAGVGALVLRRLDRTRPVTVDEAVDRFRASHPPSATVAPGATPTTTLSNAPAGPSPTASGGPGTTGGTRLPSRAPGGGAAPHDRRTPEGVYVYATTGYETADAGVPQARHDYPADTTMTVTHEAGCGSHIRWDATADRWDDVRDCVSSTSSVTTEYTTYHRFFGQEERRDYRCGPTAYLRPPPGTTRWTFDCATADGKARTHTDARIVGTERMTVGGAGVEALHVSFGTTLTGSSRGSNPVEYWLALNEPYVLRKTWRVDADVTTDFGTITYHEEYDVRLTSRTPRR
jgi:hypothetical protein